jgi:Zn-dependent protease
MGGEELRTLVLFAPPFILSLSVHEWAHAWAANKLGDPTPKLLGRLTLDPMAHISWLGTVLFPAIAIMTGAPLFGWAKPVLVNTRFFKKPRRDHALVAAAGPISNIFLAVLFSFLFGQLLKFFNPLILQEALLLKASLEMISNAIQLNVFLFLFNLIPLPPLDGSSILMGLLPRRMSLRFQRFANSEMAFWFFLLMLATGFFRYISLPALFIIKTLKSLFF